MLCFSDVDGTLVHYQADMLRHGEFVDEDSTSNKTWWRERAATRGSVHEILRLPPSHSGAQGTISLRSLQLIASIRAHGAKFVLVTGGRLSTLLQRLPFLPAADAYVCENGGRIFYPASEAELPTACPLEEDLQWRLQHLSAGPPSQEWESPDCRKGELWDAYRRLKAAGWHPDTTSYTTCFRLKVSSCKHEADLREVAERDMPGLRSSFNLGSLDIYPETSGKNKAGLHLLSHFRMQPKDSVLLCDDDNDLCLASLVARVFLPSITSESVEAAVQREPSKFVTSTKPTILATEQMLEHVSETLRRVSE